MVYSVSLFLMLTVLLALAAFWLEAADRRTQTIETASDMEVLNARLAELRWASMQQLGINASMGRNSSAIWLNVSDDGFPLTNASEGRARIWPLKVWLEANWTATTHTTLNYNASSLNASGLLLQTTSGFSYSQDNSETISDKAVLSLPTYNNTNLSALGLSIACVSPSEADRVDYADTVPPGRGTVRTLHFSTTGSYNASADVSDNFAPADDQNFSALYYDLGNNWMQTLHADWRGLTSSFVVWEEFNESYAGVGKNLTRCNWNISARLNDSNWAGEELWLPINATISYGTANYSGWLVLARE
ncbi:MAG: hypothetical protein M1530_04360 [Candidatus Marsarchaeota archaeon]|nr:hypothetical protein [Candidatus Marsarchaeota archaeon]